MGGVLFSGGRVVVGSVRVVQLVDNVGREHLFDAGVIVHWAGLDKL